MNVDVLTKNDLDANNKKLVALMNKSFGEKFVTKTDLKKELSDLEKRLEAKFVTKEELQQGLKGLEMQFQKLLTENNKIALQQLADMLLKSPILEEKLERKVKETLQKAFS